MPPKTDGSGRGFRLHKCEAWAVSRTRPKSRPVTAQCYRRLSLAGFKLQAEAVTSLILIYTETIEKHREVTRRVLELLRENKLFLKPDKCKFEKTKVEYLGIIISHNSVEMDPVKVAGVAEWLAPTNKKEVQSFLGFTNFYRRFIQDFSHHACPLFNLTKADIKWKWTEDEQSAFDSLKKLITSAPILASPDNEHPFRIEADSSDFATGAVLSQQSLDNEKWHPVAFLSKSLSAVEQNYEIHDKEMLAII